MRRVTYVYFNLALNHGPRPTSPFTTAAAVILQRQQVPSLERFIEILRPITYLWSLTWYFVSSRDFL